MRTLPFTYRNRITLNSDANGFANLLFSPQYGYVATRLAAVYTGNSVTQWPNAATQGLIDGVQSYRIVSVGFKIRHIVSPLNSAGMIYIRQYPIDATSPLTEVDTTTYNCSASLDVPVQEASEVCVSLQRTAQMPQNFYKLDDDNSQVLYQGCKGFCPTTVALAGCPASTPIIELEFLVHYELAFSENSGLAQLSTPPPPHNSMLTNVAGVVTSTLAPMINKGSEHFGRLIFDRAATALGTYLAGPAGGMAARTALAITVD